MNWKDELEDEKDYTICPICFPEYVYCNEHCKEYIEFKQFYEKKEKNRDGSNNKKFSRYIQRRK